MPARTKKPVLVPWRANEHSNVERASPNPPWSAAVAATKASSSIESALTGRNGGGGAGGGMGNEPSRPSRGCVA